MRELQSYTIDELVEETGVSRRNIRLYISMGLLPSVGRRGPRTRYGQEFVDRLKFIQRVKQLQDVGQIPHSTLDYLGGTFKHILTAEEVAEASRSNTRTIELFAQMRVNRAKRRAARARGASDDDSSPLMARQQEPDMSGYGEADEFSADEPEQWWSTPLAASSGDADQQDRFRSSRLESAVQLADPAEAADIEDLQEELSVTRIRAQTEIQELTKLTDEVSEQRSILQHELEILNKRIKRIRGKSDDE